MKKERKGSLLVLLFVV